LEGEAALIAALISERDPLRGAARGNSDLRDRIAAVTGQPVQGAEDATIHRIRTEARRLSRARADRRKAQAEAGRLAALAYPDRIALRRLGDKPSFLFSGGRGAVIDDLDPLQNERLLVATDVEDGPEARIRIAVPISEGVLRSCYGHAITRVEQAFWSARERRVEARRQERLGALALTDEIWRDVDPSALARALGDGIRERGIAALPWSDKALRVRSRLAWLRLHSDELCEKLPDVSDDALMETLHEWLVPHLSGMRRIEEIASLPLDTILLSSINWELRQIIERLAPAFFTSPLGSRIPVDYSGDAPKVSVRVQEVFGVDAHPAIGEPSQPLVIELLSPARRPVQLTSDLPRFWRTSYLDVRKDMRARYPRHPWPEEPWLAEPTARTRPRRATGK
ncbi:MAG: ATP-dependent helicase C-terminal domain-containing protein, partial [Pseudomonadota bacterium]